MLRTCSFLDARVRDGWHLFHDLQKGQNFLTPTPTISLHGDFWTIPKFRFTCILPGMQRKKLLGRLGLGRKHLAPVVRRWFFEPWSSTSKLQAFGHVDEASTAAEASILASFFTHI